MLAHERTLAQFQTDFRCPRLGWRLLNSWLPTLTFILACVLCACTTQLAPGYDKNIVDGLTGTNEQTMTLFASLSESGGSPFSGREATYNAIIGKFDALRLEAMARPNPQPPGLGFLIGSNNKTGSNISERLKAPTPDILAKTVAELTRMRNQDKAGLLTADLVALYKNSYELSFSQALTYEKALQR